MLRVTCGTLKSPCVDSKRLYVHIRNVLVARVADMQGDVLNVHTEAFLNPHTGNRTNQTNQ